MSKVARIAGKGEIFTPTCIERMVSFIAENGWNIGAVAEYIGTTSKKVRQRMSKDADFFNQIEQARMRFLGTLEAEAFRRAVKGVEVEKIGPGGIIHTITEYSDSLLAMLLKANGRDKYGDRVHIEEKREINVKLGFDNLPLAARLKFLEAIEMAAPEVVDVEARILPANATTLPSTDVPGVPESGPA